MSSHAWPPRADRSGLVAVALVIAAACLGGCVSVSSNARPAAAAEVSPARGWVAVSGIRLVRQKSLEDCGPAALAMVAQHWSVPLTLPEASRAAAPRAGRGTRLGVLRDVARDKGLTAFAIRADRTTLVHELERGRPVVVGLLRGTGKRRVSHYEVVIGFHRQRGEVATIDPSAGFAVRRWSELAAEWDPVGRPALVVLGPTRRASRLEKKPPTASLR